MKEVIIDSGTLSLKIDHLHENYTDIEEILDFASRKNPKRGFLFVSKILGKHIPVKPSVMRNSYNLVADLVGPLTGSTLVVGMSETATGLGGGVADSIAKDNASKTVIFQHTTRHELEQEKWFSLSEDHSHAVSHIVYKPNVSVFKDVVSSDRLVLVDDEISTGKTLLRLAKGYMLKMDGIEHLDIVALVSWLDDKKTEWFKKELNDFCSENNLELPILSFHHLAHGSFDFIPNPDFDLVLPEKTDKEAATEISSAYYGRTGLKMPVDGRFHSYGLPNSQTLSVVGTGEHLLFPFLYAESLESKGYDVIFQSTTRSPVFNDNSVIKTTDIIPIERDNSPVVHHYIYNLNREHFIIPVNETASSDSWYKCLTLHSNEQLNADNDMNNKEEKNTISTYFFTDIDDTLLQSTNKITAGISSKKMSKNKVGDYIGSSTLSQLSLMGIMRDSGLIIPVTGRDSAGLERCNIEWDSFKIVSHGALVLNNDNTINKEWLIEIQDDLDKSKPELEKLLSLVTSMKEEVKDTFMQDITIRVLEDKGLPIYLCGHQATGNDFVNYLSEKIKDNIPMLTGWRLHVNGRNFAILPPYASKARAVKFVKQELGVKENDLTIGLGDSMSDLAFMNECEMWLAPTKSQINESLIKSDQTGVENNA